MRDALTSKATYVIETRKMIEAEHNFKPDIEITSPPLSPSPIESTSPPPNSDNTQ